MCNSKAISATRKLFVAKFFSSPAEVRTKLVKSLGTAQVKTIANSMLSDGDLGIQDLSAMLRGIRWLDNPEMLDVVEVVEFELEDGTIGRIHRTPY